MIYDSHKNITWYDFTKTPATNWEAQMAWAANLTVNFGGKVFDDWRLPIEYPEAYTGLWCVHSEIGHLYYTELGNALGGTKTGPFKNLKAGYYWTGTEFSVTSDRSNAWCFFMLDGMNGYTAKYDPRYAIAVRDGDVITPYDTWASAFTNPPLSVTAAGSDPDNDGCNNLGEFAFNGDPRSGVNDGKVVGKVVTLPSDSSNALTLTLPVRNGATFSGVTEQVSTLIDGIVYTIQGSDTLEAESWTLVIAEITGSDALAVQSGLPPLSAGWTYRTFRSPGTVTDGDSSDFLRVKVTQP